MKENIRPGECWMAQLSKRELCVRESRDGCVRLGGVSVKTLECYQGNQGNRIE